MSTVWEIAAGNTTRDYRDLFFEFGVACVGPGEPGRYFGNECAYNQRGVWSYRRFMRPFCEQVEKDHLLALRGPHENGQPTIHAVGLVTSAYRFDEGERLSDVEGWNLAHYHEVEWHVGDPAVIGGLSARGGTLAQIHKAAPQIRELFERWKPHPARPLPPRARDIKHEDEIISMLIDEGLPTGQAEAIVHTLWKVRRLARWYKDHRSEVSEHEIRSFVIVPLLLALGWSEQRIKIEWRHRDIALFDRPYGNSAQLQMLVESKRLDGDLGVRSAEQVRRYAEDHASCRHLLITDGLRYKLSQRGDGDWPAVAYINLLRLRDRHPYQEKVAGIQAFLARLLPERLPFVAA
jgi:hypothetical protein